VVFFIDGKSGCVQKFGVHLHLNPAHKAKKQQERRSAIFLSLPSVPTKLEKGSKLSHCDASVARQHVFQKRLKIGNSSTPQKRGGSGHTEMQKRIAARSEGTAATRRTFSPPHPYPT
jgi:hypothetical protein